MLEKADEKRSILKGNVHLHWERFVLENIVWQHKTK